MRELSHPKKLMSLLSDVRLGIDLGLIKDLDKDILKTTNGTN